MDDRLFLPLEHGSHIQLEFKRGSDEADEGSWPRALSARRCCWTVS